MLVAAKKIPVSGAAMFPFEFEVTDQDVMMGGSGLGGAVRVEARIDQDGDAMSKQPGDVVAPPVPTTVGTGAIRLDLNGTL